MEEQEEGDDDGVGSLSLVNDRYTFVHLFIYLFKYLSIYFFFFDFKKKLFLVFGTICVRVRVFLLSFLFLFLEWCDFHSAYYLKYIIILSIFIIVVEVKARVNADSNIT